jgi:hypothetical protein
MQSFSTQEKISRLISKIQNDWKRANSESHGVSRIDKDILTDDIKNLYEMIYELDIAGARQNLPHVEKSLEKIDVKDDDNPVLAEIHTEQPQDIIRNKEVSQEIEPEEKPEKQAEEKPVQQVDEQPEAMIGEKAASMEINEKEKEPVEIQPPPELEIVANDTDGEETTIKAEEIKKDAPAPFVENNSKPGSKVTLDLFSTSKTLADVYQKDEDNSLAAKIQQNKITDIKTAIGINDKFLFINEIFKGEMSSYNQAIETLNDTSNFHEAVHYIDHLKLSYANEENKTSFNKLFEIAKRRFH